MLAHTYIPQPPLARFVHSFWLYESNQPSSARERVLPSGTSELVINLQDEALLVSNPQGKTGVQSFRHALFSGAQSQFFDGEMPGQVSLLGVHFKPGGAYPFLGLPASELVNSFESLEVLKGDLRLSLRDKLLAASTPAIKFQLLEHYLLAELRRSRHLNPIVAFALQELRKPSKAKPLAELTKEMGISSRHFIQIFSNEVGLTPKLFCRIQRFQRVVRWAEKAQEVEWGDLSLACGYYDQAHLIHEFLAFSGCTPTEFLKRKTGRPNHVAV